MNAFDAIVIGLALAALISIVFTSLRVGISPMPSSRKAQQAIISAIPQNTEGLIFDLGSGWGNVVLPLARSFPLATIRGVEVSLIPWAVSQIRASLSGPSNLNIERGNFWLIIIPVFLANYICLKLITLYKFTTYSNTKILKYNKFEYVLMLHRCLQNFSSITCSFVYLFV